MPRGDQTGPMGMGMRTGRGAGFCGGEERPGYTTASFGFRYGRGGGYGRGCRGAGPGRGCGAWSDRPGRGGWPLGMRYSADMQPYGRPDLEMEKRMLKRQADDLQIQLDAVRKRLEEIGTALASS